MLSFTELQNHGLTLEAILASLFYSVVGLVLMIVAISVCNFLLKLNLRKEILEDHNVSTGIVVAGMCISVALIVCASII